MVADNNSISGDILNIAMVMNGANSSGVGEMWLSLIPGDSSYPESAVMLQFTNPFQFSVGSNKFGVIELIERRQIAPSFIDMMGFTTVCDILLALFLVWLTQLDRPEIHLYWFDVNSSAYT